MSRRLPPLCWYASLCPRNRIGDRRLNVTVSLFWESMTIVGHLPFNTYVEADAGFGCLGPKILAGTLVVRPKLPLGTDLQLTELTIK